jgi:hypothetical protein
VNRQDGADLSDLWYPRRGCARGDTVWTASLTDAARGAKSVEIRFARRAARRMPSKSHEVVPKSAGHLPRKLSFARHPFELSSE